MPRAHAFRIINPHFFVIAAAKPDFIAKDALFYAFALGVV